MRGVTHRNGDIAAIALNHGQAVIVSQEAGVTDWQIHFDVAPQTIIAASRDVAGNVEQTPHESNVRFRARRSR